MRKKDYICCFGWLSLLVHARLEPNPVLRRSFFQNSRLLLEMVKEGYQECLERKNLVVPDLTDRTPIGQSGTPYLN